MARLLLVIGIVLVMSVCISDGFRWTKQPEKPTILVEGVNSTNVLLVWEFLFDPGENLFGVSFQRQKPAAAKTTTIASRLANSAFNIFRPYQHEYVARLPNTLQIRNVTKNEEYIYSIKVAYVKNNALYRITDQVKVILYDRPRINKYQGNPVRRRLEEGNNITFHCNVTDGSPKPTVTWYFGWTTRDKRVDPNYDQRYSFPTEEEWTITGVERRDKGKYRCIAENFVGKDELRFEITDFVDGFRWTKQPEKPTILVEGVNSTNVLLVWEFLLDQSETLVSVSFQRKKPAAVVTTTVASRLANSAFNIFPPYQHEYVARLPNTLQIRNVTKNEEYIYSIVVVYVKNNALNRITDQVKVILYDRPRINKYQGNPVRRRLEEGNNITLHCNVTAGSPKPTVTWYFGWTTRDKRVDPNYDQRYSFPTEEEWTITGVERRDKGKYRCIAENFVGKDELRFEITDFVDRPRINKYQGNPVRRRLEEGNNITFHCNVTDGSPKPTVTWYFGWTTRDKRVDPNYDQRYSFPTEEEWTITGVERRDKGKYRCIAENFVGKDELRFEITDFVDGFRWTKQPEKPTILVEGVNSTNVLLVWEFLLDPSETLVSVSFQRKKPAAVVTTTIASRLANSAFNIFRPHQHEYVARLPNTLQIRNVTKNEEYIYSIVVVYAKNNALNRITDQVKVILYDRPRINKYQGNPVRRRLEEGNNITLHCNVTAGSPKPTVTWYFGWTTRDKRVDPNYDQRYSFPTEEEWTITSVERRDKGKYRCIAENFVGKDELRFEITDFVDGFRWTKQPEKPTILVEGVNSTNVLLVWEFLLDPSETLVSVSFQRKKPAAVVTTTIASRLANSAFNIFRPHQHEYVARLPNTLQIRNVTKNEEYIYSIVVVYVKNNALNRITDQVKVILYDRPRINKYQGNPVRRRLEEGNNITFHCNVTAGSPKPTVTWYFGWTTRDKRVDPNYDQRYSFPTEEEWTITGVERRDKGKYRCIAENIAGKDELRFEITDFVERPKISRYQGDPVRRRVTEGNNITLHCHVTAGAPKPTISWFFGWTTTNTTVDPISDSRYSFPTDEKLTITGVEKRDEGKYRCIAKNIAGKDELRFEISAVVVCQDRWPKSTCRYLQNYCNHPVVYPICKKTCNMCSFCADRWPELLCRFYRQWCNYPTVLNNCRKTCKTCS